MIKHKLSFGKGNAKLTKQTAIFSLPAGWTCPAALLCLSKASKTTGKLTDGKQTVFRCYAASAENLFPNVRKSRWNNLEAMNVGLKQGVSATADIIVKSLPRKATAVRVHQSGDFFSQTYFDAWLEAARRLPSVLFYAYTKALPFWISRLGFIPANFKLVASRGGKHDSLIDLHKLCSVRVVFSQAEAQKAGLALDHDDDLARKADKDFALLLHGTQPKNTEASKVLYGLRKLGVGGYKANYFGHYSKQVSANKSTAK